VNFEQIARWNPDKIFVVVWYTLDPKKVIQDLKSDPQWFALKAVAKGQLYAFPTDIFGWDTPEMRWILGMNWLATRIHPEHFKDIDMKAELMAFFSQLYGMDKTAIETLILPRVKMDVR
jgi:iron complex transport system substrate-binding protein